VYEDLKGELGLDHFEGRTFGGWQAPFKRRRLSQSMQHLRSVSPIAGYRKANTIRGYLEWRLDPAGAPAYTPRLWG
jgi:hypothetical protein